MVAFDDENFAKAYDRIRKPPDACVQFYGAVVREEARLLAAEPKRSISCFDLGAGTGTYSTMLEGAAGDLAKLIALEPAAAMYAQLSAAVAGTRWIVRREGLPPPIPFQDGGFAWVSDVVHLLESPVEFAADLGTFFPNLSVVVLRMHIDHTIKRCEWRAYFPSAFAADAPRHPSPESMITAMRAANYRVARLQLVDESFDLPSLEYVSYFQQKGFSGLHLLSDTEFEEGMKLVLAAAKEKQSLRRIIWRALFVFRKEEA